MGYSILMYIVVGAIIGALARLFMKGDQPIGIVWTNILGALGAAIGGTIAGALFNNPNGILAWVVSVLVAMGLISLYLGFQARR